MNTAISRKVRRLAWLMWGIAMAAQFLNLFHRMAGGTVADKLMADFGTSATVVGGLMGLIFWVYVIMQFPGGVLADTFGARRMLSFGCLIASIGSVVFGLAPSLPVLFAARLVVSLGISVIFVSVMKIATEWFSSYDFGFISALTAALAQTGTIAAATPLALLVTGVGWRNSFELMGLLGGIIALVCWLVVRDRPRDLGLPSPSELAVGRAGSRPSSTFRSSLSLRQKLMLVLANRLTWPPFLLGIGLWGTLQVLNGAWGIPYLMQVYGMTRSNAANYMLLVTFGMMTVAVSIGHVVNKIVHRRRLPAIVCTLAYLSLWLMLTFWHPGRLTPPALGAVFFLIGYFNGYQNQNLALAKEVTSPLVSGAAIGIVNMAPFLAASVLQPLFGRMLDLGWQGAVVGGARVYPLEAFHSGFLMICGVIAVSSLGAFLTKETRCRNLVTE